MESQGGDRDKIVLDRIVRLEMVGVVGKTLALLLCLLDTILSI